MFLPEAVSFQREMYAETGLLFPYFQNFYQELQQLEEYCKTHKPDASMVPPIPLLLQYISTFSYSLWFSQLLPQPVFYLSALV